jgi:hypothetical protein
MPEREKQPAATVTPLRGVVYAPPQSRLPQANGVPVLMPLQEEEPPLAQGIDLSGRPKIVLAAGRGRVGKTKLLRWLAEESFGAGSRFVLADIDPSNAMLSAYAENVARPDTDDPAGVRAWLLDLLRYAAAEKQSVLVDLGGGDTTLRTLMGEVPGLVAALEGEGLATVMFYPVGCDPEDLTPALTLAARGFTATAQAIVLNEGVAPLGLSRQVSFARLMGSAGYAEMARSSLTLWMPRNFAAEAVDARHAGFRSAIEGCDPPLDFIDKSRLAAWLAAMGKRFGGVRTWLP